MEDSNDLQGLGGEPFTSPAKAAGGGPSAERSGEPMVEGASPSDART